MLHSLAIISATAVLGFQGGGQTVAFSAEIGKPAPAFSATGADGKTYSLKDFAGKFVVLEWTNKDCPFVLRHYNSGNMQVTQKRAKEMGAVWLAVCSSAPGKQGYLEPQAHLEHLKAVRSQAHTVLVDKDGTLGKRFGAMTSPQIAIIDPKGLLIYNGAIDDNPRASLEETRSAKNYVLAALQEAMSGKPVTIASSRPYGCGIKY